MSTLLTGNNLMDKSNTSRRQKFSQQCSTHKISLRKRESNLKSVNEESVESDLSILNDHYPFNQKQYESIFQKSSNEYYETDEACIHSSMYLTDWNISHPLTSITQSESISIHRSAVKTIQRSSIVSKANSNAATHGTFDTFNNMYNHFKTHQKNQKNDSENDNDNDDVISIPTSIDTEVFEPKYHRRDAIDYNSLHKEFFIEPGAVKMKIKTMNNPFLSSLNGNECIMDSDDDQTKTYDGDHFDCFTEDKNIKIMHKNVNLQSYNNELNNFDKNRQSASSSMTITFSPKAKYIKTSYIQSSEIYAPAQQQPVDTFANDLEMKYAEQQNTDIDIDEEEMNNFSYDDDIQNMLNNSIAHSEIHIARSRDRNYNKQLQTIRILSRIKNVNARQIWLHASLQSDDNMQKVDNCEEFAYLYDLYPFLVRQFHKISGAQCKYPQMQELEDYFLKKGGMYRPDIHFPVIHISKYNKFYAWFVFMCSVVSDLRTIYDYNHLECLFYGKQKAVEILRMRPCGTFVLSLTKKCNYLSLKCKQSDKNNDILSCFLVRYGQDLYAMNECVEDKKPLRQIIRSLPNLKYLYTPQMLMDKNLLF